jgi:hypothetical protein
VDPGVEKDGQQEKSLYLPSMHANAPLDVRAAATTATWQTIKYEGFEGVWPAAGDNWYVRDYNGSVGGTFAWNDTSTKRYAGSWSAHPTSGPPYGNHAHTYMEYGPFSLVGAQDARMTFQFWLDTETGWDFFTWGFSCAGTTTWGQASWSGFPNRWTSVNQSLSACVGSAIVYVRFTFMSDDTNTDQGVWVDHIRIEQYR